MAEWQGFRVAAAVAALLVARSAAAQQAPAPHGVGQGERRMQSGDCAGALDAFDRDIRATHDPALRRDRGTCHEKLGHPFPAIDDYRAYLTQRPGAPDAEAVRARLEALEAQVGILKQAGDPAAQKAARGTEVSVTIGGETDMGAAGGPSANKGLDVVERDEQLDLQADGSSIRRGRGFVFGLAVYAQRFGKSEVGWAELAGVDLRYSLSQTSTLLLELAFAHVNGTGTDTALGGPAIVAGYEARIPLNPRVNDAILLGGTLGYEHLSQGSSGFVYSVIEPQARLGYRHVFGASFGLEAAFDGGLALLHLTGVANATDTTTSVLGGHVAFVVGF